ncbi:hypothetical protein Fmac_008142 [Flemingia macrophylla]|uniref:Uncharacterized protein n=1 Tax=Flemingia macrophylla TaxID=520843 RepID=A0ABD1MXF1_9FABA
MTQNYTLQSPVSTSPHPSRAAAPPPLQRPSGVPLPPFRHPSADTLGNAPPYLVYTDHLHKEIVQAVRGLNLAKEIQAWLVLSTNVAGAALLWVSVIKFLKDLCNNTVIDYTNLLTSFIGPNCCLNPSIVNVFLDHEPKSTSTKNMIHLSQSKFDHIVLSYTATSDHGIIWIEKDAEKALQVSDQESVPTNGTNSQREEGSG